jgi:hypothetical protein
VQTGNPGARRGATLGGYPNEVVQKLGSEVSAVGPNNRAQIRPHSELSEIGRIAQRLKDLSVKFTFQIHIAFVPIGESHVQHTVAHVMGLNHA